MSRSEILSKLSSFEEENCKRCKFKLDLKYCFLECPLYSELRSLGEQLEEISRSKAYSLIEKGENMSDKDIAYLIIRGFTIKDISKYMGISTSTGYKVVKRIKRKMSIMSESGSIL